jgi:hypothetical protein
VNGVAANGIAMLALFALAAYLMYARVLPALLAVPLLALALAAVAGAGFAGMQSTLVLGTAKLAPAIVTVVFGAMLSRVTLSTGIAETLVSFAAEFGGDRPVVLALALAAVVAVLFVSLTGLGAIIMVGSIVLPIMMTIGIARKTAATLFLLAFALGFIFSPAQWTFYTTTFGVQRAQLQPYAFALGGVDLVALVVFAFVQFRTTRGSAAWAVNADEPLARKRVPVYALVAPIVPIAIYASPGNISAVVAFSVAAVYAAVAVDPRRAIGTIVASAIRGVEDVAPAILLFMGIGMIVVATGLPEVKSALAPIVAAIAPHSWFAYVLLFGVLSPLALYRGPLNPFGVGIAVFSVLAGLGVLPAVVLVAAIMAVVQVQNVCDPTNTQNVWVANFTAVRVGDITKATLPYQVAVATLGTLAVVLFGGALLGVQPFALSAPASAAVPAPPGLFAPPAARDTIAISPAHDDASRRAAAEIARQIGEGWSGYATVPYDGNPGDGDCAAKRFAAVLGIEAFPQEVGLTLVDCAGWPVDQWYVPRSDDVRADALAALLRLRTWMVEKPVLARELFDDGLAYDPSTATPTYFYSLFKTGDGQMRAYVRPGGPAYAAGLRTNDIVEKLDGKYWWEYGTFQTQARAYDGKPHVFVIMRGKVESTVALGAPFAP